MSALRVLVLSNNLLIGDLPTSLGLLQLEWLDLSNNLLGKVQFASGHVLTVLNPADHVHIACRVCK
jgi:hypothetical protein